jgi:hypothetical protein
MTLPTHNGEEPLVEFPDRVALTVYETETAVKGAKTTVELIEPQAISPKERHQWVVKLITNSGRVVWRKLPWEMIQNSLPPLTELWRRLVAAQTSGKTPPIDWECEVNWRKEPSYMQILSRSGFRFSSFEAGRIDRVKGYVHVKLTGTVTLYDEQTKKLSAKTVMVYEFDLSGEPQEFLFREWQLCDQWRTDVRIKEDKFSDPQDVLDKRWNELLKDEEAIYSADERGKWRYRYAEGDPKRPKVADFVKSGITKAWKTQIEKFVIDLQNLASAASGGEHGGYEIIDHRLAENLSKHLQGMRGAKLLLRRYLELVSGKFLAGDPCLQEMLRSLGPSSLFDDQTFLELVNLNNNEAAEQETSSSRNELCQKLESLEDPQEESRKQCGKKPAVSTAESGSVNCGGDKPQECKDRDPEVIKRIVKDVCCEGQQQNTILPNGNGIQFREKAPKILENIMKGDRGFTETTICREADRLRRQLRPLIAGSCDLGSELNSDIHFMVELINDLRSLQAKSKEAATIVKCCLTRGVCVDLPKYECVTRKGRPVTDCKRCRRTTSSTGCAGYYPQW